MPAPLLTETYSPLWCPNVVGRYSPRQQDPETGMPEEQLWEAECTACKARWGPAACTSGLVRNHIANFAKAHTHRDALQDPFPKERAT